MTKITIFSGFLGAGKTTLIKKLIAEGYKGEKLVLIENEFGQIGIDGGFLQDAGVEITEMNSGCICCSLVGDFGKALKQVLETYKPDRILIEPSGVGKLSDVIKAVQNIDAHDVVLDGFTTVVDANKCRMYQKNFGEFFNNQITYASCLILSHTAGVSQERLDDVIARLRALNDKAPIVTTEWDQLTGEQLTDAMTQKNTLDDELKALLEQEHEHHHHHHHDDDDDEHEHHHHHDDDDEHEHHHHDHDDEHEHHHHDHDDEHEHHHHDHDDEHEHHHHDHDDEHEHHHHDHDHGEGCTCGCHDHDHEHHHHHADEVFQSWGRETTKKYTQEEIKAALEALEDEKKYGLVLRAKGIVEGTDGTWIHYDYVPGVPDVRTGSASTIGILCVIGAELKEDAVAELFGVQ
ncbi:GTP-binding protein [Ruminococcus albus]|uniref:CobW/P47K family protein n=1 Tax=Ruminococcus albus 8 TaxID=246199 RepID=E9S9C0_RUMAL|nr:GTP-binding protein [Ruminococcus albus]EGC04115.1 CobW/P47K family protein [Ruminococcus albus 8]MCC3350722.1 GTP-binding protein [Ruminococcus albus 8]